MRDKLCIKLRNLECSLIGFKSDVVVDAFMSSDYYSSSLSFEQLVKRCLSWYAEELSLKSDVMLCRIQQSINNRYKKIKNDIELVKI